ncbi:MAG: beta-galactosidase [Thermoguttaceae bacterium]|nr:beta-galactosidase [Thermoguttaceae bacterium]
MLASEACESPYGVCAHVSRGDERPVAQKEFALMSEAGIAWVRTDFDWSGVERPRGNWTFDHLDVVVSWAEKAGICLLPILDYDVPWARPAYKHLDAWLEYVRRVVSRYKGRLRYWEVWNEPNLEGFWRDKPDPANYVSLLRATYQEIKRIDPNLVVVLGGMAGIPWEYLEGVYKAGGKDFFDVMNVHPYRYPRAPEEGRLVEDLQRLRQLMSQYGDGQKPIWITEIGWPTHVGPRGVSEEVQAQMLPRAYLLALHEGVERVIWYEFQAPEGKPDYNEDHFGIVHRDLRPKPAYVAYRTLTSLRPTGSKIVAGWEERGVFCRSWDDPQGTRIWALWCPGESQEVSFTTRGAVSRVVDHLGNPKEHAAADGRLRLSLGPGVTYVVGPEAVSLQNTSRAEDGNGG